jgi:hypothetical protein
MKNYFFALTLLVILLAACSDSKVSISYNARYCKDHVVKIDDTMTLKTDSGKQYFKRTMEPGKHTLTIDGGKPVTFELKEDAILNLDHQEFVVFPIEFSYGNSEKDNMLRLLETHGDPNILIIDSFVVGNTHLMAGTDSTWNRGRIQQEAKSTEFSELVKTDSNQLVVNKTWDIGVADEIPKSVEQFVQKGSKSASTFRKKAMDARMFVLYASISGTYTVKQLSDFK